MRKIVYLALIGLNLFAASTNKDFLIQDNKSLKLSNSNNTFSTSLKSPANLGENITLTLPNTKSTNNQMLKVDANGNLEWVDNNLSSLSDVNATGLINNSILIYDATLSKWKISSVAASSDNQNINNLSLNGNILSISIQDGNTKTINLNKDLNLTNLFSDNNITQIFQDVNVSISDLKDVNTSGLVSGQILKYNGTSWLPQTVTTTENDFTDTLKTKLSNIDTNATKNDTDVNLKNRANHTGTQTASTISDLNTTITNNSAVAANTAKVTNATHTGDVTGATALTIGDDKITTSKIADTNVTKAKLNSDVFNNTLTSDATDEALTAKQGKTLKDTLHNKQLDKHCKSYKCNSYRRCYR
jgi:hypothetical protein